MSRWPVNEEAKAAAIRAVREGQTPYSVARILGVTGTTIRMWTDPEYAQRRRDQVNHNRAVAEGKTPKHRMPSMPRVPM